MNTAAQQAKMCETEIFNLKRNIRKNELAITDIDRAKDSKAIYLPMGKAFVCRHPDYVKKEFADINRKYATEISELEKNHKFYETKKTDKETILKEGLQRLTKK